MTGNAQGRSLELFFIGKTYKDWEAEKLAREQGGEG